MYSSTRSGDWRYGCASRARLNRWLAASVDAKFMRDSIDEVEIQPGPELPAVDVGRLVELLAHVERAASSRCRPRSPFQPVSLIARTTYSTGHE